MRLVIDLQGAQSDSRRRGIGRYSLALARSMARHRGSHEVIIALNGAFPETIRPIRDAFKSLLPRQNFRVWSAPGPTAAFDPNNSGRRDRAEVIYESFLASLEPDFIHVSSLMEGFYDASVTTVREFGFDIPTAVTFYDLIPLHDPMGMLDPKMAKNTLYSMQLSALSRADLLLAISEFSAEDAVRYFGKETKHIVNISTACSDEFKPSTMEQSARTELFNRLELDRPYIVTSGTVELRKNLISLMRAFSQLPEPVRKAHKLAIVGNEREVDKAILKDWARSAGLRADEMVITGYIQDDELVTLYTDAKLMVFPSIDEGFGLPPLEAMACGTPTLGSRSTSISEVIGLEGAMFDPLDEKELSRLIARGLEDDAFREMLRDHAKSQARKFSWDETGKRALTAMETLLESKHALKIDRGEALERCLDTLAAKLPRLEGLRELSRALARSFPDQDQPRQLFVDISELHHIDSRTGIQRVTRSILQELLKTSPGELSVEPVYATMNEPGYRYARDYSAQLKGTPVTGPDEIIDFRLGDIFFGLDLRHSVVEYQKPWLQDMHMRGVDIRFLVYDLLPVQFPQHFPKGMQSMHQAWLETIACFDGIIGISQDVTNAFQAWRSQQSIEGDTDFRFDAVHLGADIANSLPSKGLPDNASSVLGAIKQAPCFLMVGTVEPRKGHAQALSAFERLWARDVNANLVIVGSVGWSNEALTKKLRRHPENGRRLFWLEGISDEYLQEIYAVASCLLAASEGEGFGLPLIEAAQANIPILARDIPVFREVACDHASYFRGKAPKVLAKSIEQWLERDINGQTISSGGIRWLTWAESAAQMAKYLLAPCSEIDKLGAAGVAIGRKKAI